MFPFPVQETKFDPIEKMAETLFNLHVIDRVAKEQPENKNLVEQAFEKFQAVETQISSMIDDNTIDVFLKPELFAFLGYFGCESVLRKLHDNDKLPLKALTTALAYAATSHRRFENMLEHQSPDQAKYKPISLDWLYSDLDQTYCGAFNKQKHVLFDGLLQTRRQCTANLLQSHFSTVLNKGEVTLDQFIETLNLLSKNYNTEALTCILIAIENKPDYLDAILKHVASAMSSGVSCEHRMFIPLYVEAGGNLDIKVACPAILETDKSQSPQQFMVECHLLHLALARQDAKLFFLLASRINDLDKIPPIDKLGDKQLPKLEQALLLNDLKINLLHMSIISGQKAVSADLIKRKIIDLNERSANGTTALMMAAAEKQVDTIQLLIQHNANPLLACNKGNTAISFSNNPEVIFAISTGASAWIKKRNDIIARLNKPKETKAAEETPVTVAVVVPEFEKATDTLLSSARNCYIKIIKKLCTDSLSDYENRFLPESITYLEAEKARHSWKYFFQHTYKSLYALAPYLGFFGANIDPVEDLLKLLNYDRIILILMAAYAAPNRTQVAKTGALDSFIFATPALQSQYSSYTHNHTRMNKELLIYRKDLRDYLFPLIANLIKSDMDEYLFGFAVTTCAQNRDTELLKFIVDRMMACKKPALEERYKTFLLKGPSLIYKNPEDGTQASFSQAPEHVRQFYFQTIGNPYAKKEEALSEAKPEKPKSETPAKSKKKKNKNRRGKSGKTTTKTFHGSESDSNSDASDEDIAENSQAVAATPNQEPAATPLLVPFVETKAAPVSPQPIFKAPAVSVYAAIAEFASPSVIASEDEKPLPKSPVSAKTPAQQSPLLSPAKTQNAESIATGTTESIFTALKEPSEVKTQESEMSLEDEYALEKSALTVLDQNSFDRIYAEKNTASLRLFDLVKLKDEQHARVNTLETKIAARLRAVNRSGLFRLEYMKNYLGSLTWQYWAQLKLIPKAERYEEVVANDNNQVTKRDLNIL